MISYCNYFYQWLQGCCKLKTQVKSTSHYDLTVFVRLWVFEILDSRLTQAGATPLMHLTAHSFLAFYSQSAGNFGAHASAWQPHSPSQQLGAVSSWVLQCKSTSPFTAKHFGPSFSASQACTSSRLDRRRVWVGEEERLSVNLSFYVSGRLNLIRPLHGQTFLTRKWRYFKKIALGLLTYILKGHYLNCCLRTSPRLLKGLILISVGGGIGEACCRQSDPGVATGSVILVDRLGVESLEEGLVKNEIQSRFTFVGSNVK
jgi:hypothetical protein